MDWQDWDGLARMLNAGADSLDENIAVADPTGWAIYHLTMAMKTALRAMAAYARRERDSRQRL